MVPAHALSVIFVIVFISQIVRGLLRNKSEPAPEAKPDSLEEQRRVQERRGQRAQRERARRGHEPELIVVQGHRAPPLAGGDRQRIPDGAEVRWTRCRKRCGGLSR